MKPVIQVERISKLYSMGRTSRIFHESFGSRLKGLNRQESENTFWAVKDASFEISQGQVAGIMGKNGSGKTTLMKMLSKITEPTRGKIILRGKAASLLEIGAGFYPELTGRENVFLNGSILGMLKEEIRRKFAQIVEFSGVEKFIDTPVKYYSNGMYLRLAFSVAAHLDADIVMIDEVLAVGDPEFQQKCLKRISEISREGKTILFVTHNFGHVSSICSRGIQMAEGKIIFDGKSDLLIENYVKSIKNGNALTEMQHIQQTDHFAITQVVIKNSEGRRTLTLNFKEPFEVEMEISVTRPIKRIRIGTGFSDLLENWIGRTHHPQTENETLDLEPGCYQMTFAFDNPLWPGDYYLGAGAHQADETGLQVLDFVPKAALFTVHSDPYRLSDARPLSYNHGLVALDSKSSVKKIS